MTSGGTNEVLRYNGTTGAFINVFVTNAGGGNAGPNGMIFGPDGNLYVVTQGNISHEITRYNGTTGAFIDVFVPFNSGGLSDPHDLVFGPDGNLYVTNRFKEAVMRYNGTTGAFIDVFASNSDSPMFQPQAPVFGPDGNLYVSSFGTKQVLRFNGATGAFIDVFANATVSVDELLFGADGNLYVSGGGQFSGVTRFNATTGAFIDTFVLEGSGGLDGALHMVFFDNTPPDVACLVQKSLLWPPNHNLIDVGLDFVATDDTDDAEDLIIDVLIFSDEDDEEPTGSGNHSPDAKDDGETLRLRSERKGNSDGRVYLIVVVATDAAGNVGFDCCTVVVPKSKSKKHVADVDDQALLAELFCLVDGVPPPGFVEVGDGPIIGPKQ